MTAGFGPVLDTLCYRLGLFHLSILDADLLAQLGCSRFGQYGTFERASLGGELHFIIPQNQDYTCTSHGAI